METIKGVDRELRETEDEIMKNVDRDVRESAQLLEEDRLNFGLVQVVYEWARNKVIWDGERLSFEFPCN